MYTSLLTIHSYLRWVVLLCGLIALARAIGGLTGRRPWGSADESAARWFTITLDVQFLIGLILYLFLSPFTMSAWSNLAATMRDSASRFIAIEHEFGMLVAIALAHVGRARLRKTADLVARHRVVLIFFGLAMVIILGSIPWPGMPGGRALFRGLGSE